MMLEPQQEEEEEEEAQEEQLAGSGQFIFFTNLSIKFLYTGIYLNKIFIYLYLFKK